MAKNLPTHCKNLDAVCAALGIKLPQQRPRALRIRDQVAAWTRGENVPTGIPVFPAKVKGYWPYVKVVEWGVAAGVTAAGKDKWELKPAPKVQGKQGSGFRVETSNLKPSTSTPNLPPAEKPAEGELFNPESTGFEQTLDLWQDKLENPLKWQEAPIQKWQITELKRQRPELFETKASGAVAGDSENIGGGQDGVAAWINLHFPGHAVHQMMVSRWVNGKELPPGCAELFPASERSGRFKTADVRSWCEKYLPKSMLQPGLAMTLQAALDQEKLDEIQHNQWQREMERRADDRNYVRRDAVWGLITEFARAMFSRVDATERTWPKQFAERLQGFRVQGSGSETFNLQPETVAALVDAFRAWLPGQNEALKREMEQAVAALESRSKEQN